MVRNGQCAGMSTLTPDLLQLLRANITGAIMGRPAVQAYFKHRCLK